LKKMGVDIVVDLRLSGKDTEKQNVTKAGMQFVSIPWHCMFPKDRVFAEFLKLLQENPDKKVFVHCRYGDDRTGMTIAGYRMAVQGWTPGEARKEMQKFGFHRMLCPSLIEYEKNFPKHLKNSPDFQALRTAESPSR
jgi:tyrosine-protein phosphatase SIW14